jgi:thymidylate synthase
MSEFEYNAQFFADQLILGTGRVVVVLGWTPKFPISERLDPKEFAAIGNLYSVARGLNFLIRNLLLNPHVHTVIALQRSILDQKAASVEGLIRFFTEGVREGDTSWEVPVFYGLVGLIDKDIPLENLERLRRKVRLVIESDSEVLPYTLQANARLRIPLERVVEEYPYVEAKISTKPTQPYGHRIYGQTIEQTWVSLVRLIRGFGHQRPSAYSSIWQELCCVTAVVEDPSVFPSKYLSRDHAEAYVEELLNRTSVLEDQQTYKYSDRLFQYFDIDQIHAVVQQLSEKNVLSTRAVCSLWDPKVDLDSPIPPCMTELQFMVVDDKLSLCATYRSHDVSTAWLANVYGLAAILLEVLAELNQKLTKNSIRVGNLGTTLPLNDLERYKQAIKLGNLIIHSRSAHLPDYTWSQMDDVLSKEGRPMSTYNDQTGNYLIDTLQDEEVVRVNWYSKSGRLIEVYRGNKSLNLLKKITEDNPLLEAYHAAYLGREIYRAEQSLKSPASAYEQDTF